MYGGVLNLEEPKVGGGLFSLFAPHYIALGLVLVIVLILIIVLWAKRPPATQGMQGEMRSTVGWNPSSRVFGIPITKASLAPIVREGHPVVQVSDPYGINLVPWRSNLGPNIPASDSGAREGMHAGH